MKKSNKKALLMLAIVSTLFVSSFAIINAESISTVVSAIVQRVTIALEGIGQNKVEASGNDMEIVANDTKTSIDGIVNNAEDDFSKELDQYKNARISEKNQEVESLLRDIDASVKQKKAEKLDEYKQKIDDKINKEYEKLINDLQLN
jgi:hypothetical protein